MAPKILQGEHTRQIGLRKRIVTIQRAPISGFRLYFFCRNKIGLQLRPKETILSSSENGGLRVEGLSTMLLGMKDEDLCECGQDQSAKYILLDNRQWNAERQSLKVAWSDSTRLSRFLFFYFFIFHMVKELIKYLSSA